MLLFHCNNGYVNATQCHFIRYILVKTLIVRARQCLDGSVAVDWLASRLSVPQPFPVRFGLPRCAR